MTALPIAQPAADSPRSRRPGLRVVTGRPRRSPVAWVVAALVVVAVAVAAAVTLNAIAADDAVVAAELESSIRAAEVRHGELLTEVATLESPARIASAAEELGLVRVYQPRQLHVTRLLPADGIVHEDGLVRRGGDVLKPLLAQD